MAFQSEVAPPVVGEANKDTIDGETKSDENDTEEEEDLEEGEILDSGDETEQEVPKSVEEKSPDTKTPAKPASDPQQQQQSSSEEKKHKRWNKNPDVSRSSRHSGRKSKRPKPEQESDHEESDYEDEEDDYDGDESKESWYHRPSKKHVGSDDGIIDYARELAAYRDSSDHNSPERRTDKKRERSSRKKLKSSSSHKSRSKKDSPSPSPSKRTLKRKILLDKKGKYKKGVITGRKLCKYFQEGTCAKGSDCPFIHPFPKKQELCRYYISGHCSKRKHCPYMHEEFPCKFFHTGAKCYAGDNCRYSHEPLTEETGRLLKEYLKSNSHDDHRDRGKKRRSKTPDPPQKRKCLLGSPPRHLKEAEETKHWQDEMMRLQQEKGTDAFQIHLSPSHDSSPNPYLQPDDYEYGDTMQSPPRPAMPRDGPEVGSPPHHMQPNFMPISPNHQGHPNFASSGSSAPVQQNFVSSAPPTAQMPPSFASARPPLLQLPPNFVATSTAQPQPPAPQNFGPMGPALHLQQAFMPMGPPVSQPLQPPFASMVPPLQAQAPQNQAVQDQNMKLNLDWNNIRALVDMMSAKQEEKGGAPATEGEVEQQKLETISSEKEPTQNSTSSVENTSKTALKEAAQKDWEDEKNIDSSGPNDGEAISESSRSTAEPSTSVSQSPAHVSEAPEPIVIPSHLPRKQRELLLRIQKHQKLKSADSDDTSDGMERSESESQTFGDDKQLTRSESADLCGGEEEMETKADIYSSDDDDDDDDADKPLTDVLKKLQETPPPKPKEVPPKPKIDINQMLSTIMQKAKENCPSKAMCEKQNEFWQNILLGGTPQAKALSQGSSVVDNTKNSLSQDLSTKPPEKTAPAVRDPRLKNRENRVPPMNTAPLTSSPMPPIPLLETKGMANHHRDISTAPSQTSAVVVDGLTANVPYKLHNVSTKPLNYAPYIQASLSDPKLLNDPRLRKRLQNATADATYAGSENSEDMTKPGKLPELPLFSQHKMQKCEGFGVPLHENNISSSASSPPAASTRPTLPDIKLPPLQNQPQPTPRVSDPRRRPDQRHPPGGSTPPQSFPATGPEAVRPEVPQAALPPRTSAATPSSHLPRAICDPRMAKLHHPLDPRRPRAAPESVNKGSVASNSLQRGKHQTPPQESQGDNRATAAAAAPKSDPANAEADPEQEKGEQKGKVAANEKVRNKDVLRNRKSSMEYASPLNSCDEANSSGGLKYNSYNQRPKKNLPPLLAEGNAPKEMLPPASAVISALTLEAAADEAVPSTDCGENIVPSASLKDMFKTIDPTASPFC